MPAAIGVRGDAGTAELARAAAEATASIGVDDAGLDLAGVPAPAPDTVVESRPESSAVTAPLRAEYGCDSCSCAARPTGRLLAAAVPALVLLAPGNTSNCGEAIGRATRARAALGVPAAKNKIISINKLSAIRFKYWQ